MKSTSYILPYAKAIAIAFFIIVTSTTYSTTYEVLEVATLVDSLDIDDEFPVFLNDAGQFIDLSEDMKSILIRNKDGYVREIPMLEDGTYLEDCSMLTFFAEEANILIMEDGTIILPKDTSISLEKYASQLETYGISIDSTIIYENVYTMYENAFSNTGILAATYEYLGSHIAPQLILYFPDGTEKNITKEAQISGQLKDWEEIQHDWDDPIFLVDQGMVVGQIWGLDPNSKDLDNNQYIRKIFTYDAINGFRILDFPDNTHLIDVTNDGTILFSNEDINDYPVYYLYTKDEGIVSLGTMGISEFFNTPYICIEGLKMNGKNTVTGFITYGTASKLYDLEDTAVPFIYDKDSGLELIGMDPSNSSEQFIAWDSSLGMFNQKNQLLMNYGAGVIYKDGKYYDEGGDIIEGDGTGPLTWSKEKGYFELPSFSDEIADPDDQSFTYISINDHGTALGSFHIEKEDRNISGVAVWDPVEGLKDLQKYLPDQYKDMRIEPISRINNRGEFFIQAQSNEGQVTLLLVYPKD